MWRCGMDSQLFRFNFKAGEVLQPTLHLTTHSKFRFAQRRADTNGTLKFGLVNSKDECNPVLRFSANDLERRSPLTPYNRNSYGLQP